MSAARSRPRPVGEERHMVLFVAGDEPNSRLALSNLEELRPSIEAGGGTVAVHDVLEDFRPAMEHGILVTPALLRVAPEPRLLVAGNLSDLAAVRLAFGLPPAGSRTAKAGP